MSLCFDKIRQSRDAVGVHLAEIQNCTIVEVSNVARYFAEQMERGERKAHSTIPSIRLPFRYVWLDCLGSYFIHASQKWPAQITKAFLGKIGSEGVEILADLVKRYDPNLFILSMSGCFWQGRAYPIGYHITATKDDRFADSLVAANPAIEKLLPKGMFPFGVMDSLASDQGFMLLCISLMNCRNVELIQHEHPEKLQRARTRSGKLPFVEYKQIVINPINPTNRHIYDQRGPKTDIKQRLHICRGHFKDYTQGKGLFGRINGVFWWDSEVRGNRDIGKIDHTYKIELEGK